MPARDQTRDSLGVLRYNSAVMPWLAPTSRTATMTDALLKELLAQLARHDRFPLPGTGLINHDHDVTPTLVAMLERARAQG